MKFQVRDGKNLILVIGSNGLKMIFSMLAIFILPNIFDIEGYAYYKVFLLYSSYIGLLSLGFVDGMYLQYGGIDYMNIDKSTFSKLSKMYFVTQISLALIIFLASFFFDSNYQVLLVILAFYLVTNNFIGFFQQISQVTGRISEFTLLSVFNIILNIILLLLMFLSKTNDYVLYLVLTLVINLILTVFYVFRYKELFFNKYTKTKLNIKEYIGIYKLGIPLLISNLVIISITNIPKQIVQYIFPIESDPIYFANFSFAFTLLSFTSIFLTAISIVIYPIMKKSNYDQLKANYPNFISFMSIIILLSISSFYPISFIIENFIPDYTGSLEILFIIFPSMLFTSIITVINHNYYKALLKNNVFLFTGIISIIFTVVLLTSIYFIFGDNINMMTIGTLISYTVWYILNSFYLRKKFDTKLSKFDLYQLALISFYYLSSYFKNNIISFLLYISVFVILTLLFYRKQTILLLNKGAKE